MGKRPTKSRLKESFRPTWLGLLPLLSGVLVALVLLPRKSALGDVPLPAVDTRALEAAERADDLLSKRAAFPDDVRLVGTVVRRFQTLGVTLDRAATEKVSADDLDDLKKAIAPLRSEIDSAMLLVFSSEHVAELSALRAYQMTGFLRELARFESEGKESPELYELGGNFVSRLRSVGWCEGDHVLLDDSARRVAYKSAWNALLGLDGHPSFALSLDEIRVRARFELLHPTPDRQARGSIESLRASGKEKDADALSARAIDLYRLERVERLEKVDPAYPALLAKSILETRLHHLDKAKRAYHAWTSAHPEGAYALRARNLSFTMLSEDAPR